MRSRSFIRRAAVAAAFCAVALALSGGGVQRAFAGQIALTPTSIPSVAVPSTTIPNELVIGAERSAGLCTDGICPLAGCQITSDVLRCDGSLETCHVSVDGTCLPPSTAATASADAPAAPGGCAEGPSKDICNHQDPEQTGCTGDGTTNEQVYDGQLPTRDGVWTENRWSSKCESNWARTTQEGNYRNTLNAAVDYADGSDGDYQTYNSNYMWSNMLWGGPGSSKVCAYGGGSDATDPGEGYTGCY